MLFILNWGVKWEISFKWLWSVKRVCICCLGFLFYVLIDIFCIVGLILVFIKVIFMNFLGELVVRGSYIK